MKLLLDLGNSRLKWAGYSGGLLQPMRVADYRADSLGDVCGRHWRHLSAPEAVYAASVAGPLANEALQGWVEQRWGCLFRFIRSAEAANGVHNGYTEPARLGVDRWAALAGARALYPAQACLVADCGTACTLDILDADGLHQGGFIVPGLARMRACLRQNTHALQDDYSGSPPPGPLQLGKNTSDGVNFGTVYALSALIEKLMEHYGKPSIPCILTGGGAEQLLPAITGICRHVPDLVLRGIARLTDEDLCA